MRFWVFGNVGVDETMAAEEWPSPGQTVIVGAPSRDIGGKGANQALVLRRAGAQVHLIAPIGDDEAGEWIKTELTGEGLDPADLVTLHGSTDRSMIFVAPDGENAIASVVGCAASIEPVDVTAWIQRAVPGDVLLLQGNLRFDTTERALAAARERGVRTVLNPSPIRTGFATLWPFVDVLIINREEAGIFAPGSSPDEAVRRLVGEGIGTAVLTLGRDGAIAFDRGHFYAVETEQVAAVDTTGAGDTFAGAFVAAFFGRALDLESSLRLAAQAAAITVTRPGTRGSFPTVWEFGALFGAVAPIASSG